METDSFFWQLFKSFPSTLFPLVGQPPERAQAYDFASVEIKKSFRIDGVFVPKKPALPVYFLEVQFRRTPTFYANLFAKVFLYLEANKHPVDWGALALFENRDAEPRFVQPYEDLLNSRRVTRIYLDEFHPPSDAPIGLEILRLVSAPENEVKQLVEHVRDRAEVSDSETIRQAIELTEELLLRRFTQFDREEIRKMFQLQDIRKSKVWQEAHETGVEKGLEKGREKGIEEGIEKGRDELQRNLAQRWLAEGKSVKEVAELLGVSVKVVRRLSHHGAK